MSTISSPDRGVAAWVEEFPASVDGPTRWESEAILLGAPDRATWLELARALLDWLEPGQAVALKDLAFTLNTGQPAFPFRVGMVVTSLADLKERLRGVMTRLSDPSCRSLIDPRGTYFRDAPMAGPGRLAFLFPEEGPPDPEVMVNLSSHFPEFRTQSHLLMRLGLRPDAVLGSGSGEVREAGASGPARPFGFRERVKEMHDEGVRLFVEVGGRGDLTAAVAETLRGRPHFAIAASLPGRSGLTQLNHLVAALFCQGVPLRTDHLYARRRPERVNLSAEPRTSMTAIASAGGSAPIRGAAELVKPLPEHKAADAPLPALSDGNGQADERGDLDELNRVVASPLLDPPAVPVTIDAAMASYLRTMEMFQETQRVVMEAYLRTARPTEIPTGSTPDWRAGARDAHR